MELEQRKDQEHFEETRNVLLVLTRKITFPLYFAFWLCDIIYVPELKWEFLGLRSLIIPLAILVHYLAIKTRTFQQVQMVGLIYTLGLSLPITIMIIMINDSSSPYYAGLNLVIFATLSFIPWKRSYFPLVIFAVFAPFYTYSLVTSTGTTDYVNLAVSSFFIVGAIVIAWVIRIFRDQLQFKMLEARWELEEEIEKRKQVEDELILARDAAMKANRAKSSFLANISHELRTPLTAINGFAETLLESGQTVSERAKNINTIIRNGNHLLGLLNEILDLSKIEADKMEVERIKVPTFQFIDDAASVVEGLAKAKGLEFKVNIVGLLPKEILTDPVRLKQVIINLCSNGIKFTECGYVHLNIECNAQNNTLSFVVEDSGIGLTATQIEKLFKPFTQADSSTTRKYGGTGLGLALSKRLIELMGGTITVQSEEGKGSKFILTVATGPLAGAEFAREGTVGTNVQKPESRPATNGKLIGSVLLAEDTPDLQTLISHYVRKTGATITAVENGQMAVEKVSQQAYDLVLMDLQMPVMGGIEAMTIIRENGYNGPIVALTANAMQQDKERCLAAGCNNFMSKPINKKKLIELVKSYLNTADEVAEASPITSALLEKEPELEDIVTNYVSGLPIKLERAIMALNRENWSALNNIINEIKSSADIYGYPALSKLAAETEFQLLNNNYPEVNKLVHDLRSVIDLIAQGSGIEQ